MSDERDGAGGAAFPWGLTPRVPASTPPEPSPPVEPAQPVLPAAPEWDTPTVASPVVPGSVFPLPERAPAAVGNDLATQAFSTFGTPIDAALDGPTELLGSVAVGLPVPEDEGLEPASLEDLFGESNFIEYLDEPIISALAPKASSALVVSDRRPAPVSASLTQTQKILLWVAGGLVAALALVALFLVGMRVAQSAPAPVISAEPSPTAPATTQAPLVGPVAVGEHHWDELHGGECLSPFTSAWQDDYTVVDCATPHPAQLVYRGLFADAADVAFPGVDELQKRIALLCSAPTVIDYAAAAGASDVQISASFASDDADWSDGNRTYYCFASRTGGAEFTTSIAAPAAAQ